MGPRERSILNLFVEATPQATTSQTDGSRATVGESSISKRCPGDAKKPHGFPLEEPVDDATSANQPYPRGSGGTWPRTQKSTPSTQVARETILADASRATRTSPDPIRSESARTTSAELLIVTKQGFPGRPKRKSDDAPKNTLTAQPSAMLIGKGKETVDIALPGASISDTRSADSMPSTVETNKGEASTHDKDISISKLEVLSVSADNSTLPVDKIKPPPSGWLDWFGVSGNAQATQAIKLSTSPPISSTMTSSEQDKNIIGEIVSTPTTKELNKVAGQSWTGRWSPFTSGRSKNDTIVNIQNVSGADIPSEPLCDETQSNSPLQAPGSWTFWPRSVGKAVGRGEPTVAKGISSMPPTSNHVVAMQESKVDHTAIEQERTRDGPLSSVLSIDPTLTPQAIGSSKLFPDNHLLPSFRDTYQMMENPSIIQQIANFLMRSRPSQANHVCLLKEPPRIKKAIAIGIHGFFPAALLRTVIGQPTGTSIRFSNHSAAAIHRWADKHGFQCEVEKIALEGEGRISERVDSLWKLLLNWVDHIRHADFIMVASHSQGVPVAIMLIAKLIEFGLVTTTRIGVCAMAGVSLGPFADYKSRFLSGSAAELFDFAIPNSDVSKRYEHSLRAVLKYGVKISYTGSIDDQLVSLESALFSPAHHPYIYRTVFVDGRIHNLDFIAHLVSFALKLRNLGISDHGIIRELSAPLAGSLYTSEGHSRLHDEAKIYDVAVEFSLETVSLGDVPLQIEQYVVPSNPNPFQLPWSMRGLLEEEVVKADFGEEIKVLLRKFNDWKPSSKVLKDVKYRLEAVKSKL